MELMFWNFEPSVIIGTGVLALGYALTIGPLRRRWELGEPVSRLRQIAFYLGSLCMLVALIGPLDVLGDESLFSAHMGQHMLLTFVVPPLWVVGTPGWLIRLLVPRRILTFMVNPFVAFSIFNGVVWFWHLPSFYDDALRNEWLHIGEHLLFMASAVIGWLPVLKSELTEQMTPLRKLIYLTPSMFSCTALAALITLVPVQLYTFYGSSPLQWGLTSLSDQQLGGLVMWLPGDYLYMVLIVWTVKQLLDQTHTERGQVKL
jgi:putative membrane protein